MRLITATICCFLASACGPLYEDEEIEATRDFIAANELQEVASFRINEQLNYRVVNAFFVTVDTRRGDYLLEFHTRCRALARRDFTPEMVDIRRDPNRIRARFDTIRGCMIGKIYPISNEQREELRELGDAPGEEIYLPDEDESAADEDDAGT